ncbi:L,D-transpeptidase [Anaerobacillus isosaccharinicus]|uniref:L,D-transpeptidase n=1 Tax=Anaerobacillus isosaccharinicus TaxID=1532552 RepID=A0A1S2L223_9BACI|nr:L,D-transpeptidase [Anaerobacillus isosaccharinicus]QOY37104.1 L,D-transpeptidase [Anaerobacillus isosaccharinicus]
MKRLLIIAIIFSSLFIFNGTSHASQNNQLIIINKSTNELAFFDHNQLVKTFPIATGRTDSLTPEGTFKIVNKIKNRPYYKDGIPGGDPQNPLGDRWLGLDARGTYGTTYAIHGNNNPNSIGKYVSAGCVRMHNEDVRWLFEQVILEAKVIITHSDQDFSTLALSYGYQSMHFFQADQDLTVYDNRKGFLEKVGTLYKGQVYPFVSTSGNWHKIQFGKIEAFVYAPATSVITDVKVANLNNKKLNSTRTITPMNDAVVYDNTSGSLVPFATLSKDISYPIVADYGPNWYEVVVAGRVGYIYKISTDRSKKYFKTNETVSVYDNSTGTLVKVGELVEGQVYQIYSDYGNWHQIEFGNGYGYVYKLATSVADSSNLKNINTNYTNSGKTFKTINDAMIYDNSSGSLVPFARITNGEIYPIVSDYAPNWYRVLVAGRVGYIHKKDVEQG